MHFTSLQPPEQKSNLSLVLRYKLGDQTTCHHKSIYGSNCTFD